MHDISRPQLAVYAVAAIAVLVVGARYLLQERGGAPAGGPPAAAAAGGATTGGGGVRVSGGGAHGPIVVDVTGAVRRPGVYRLPAGSRVQDAVRRAGGATQAAQLSAINLAAKAADGAQILVPARAPAAGAATAGAGGGAGGAGASSGAASAGPAATGAPAAPISLSSATAAQLEQLDGVGPVTAKKILEYRSQHGGFGSVAELDRISGIGPKRLAALRDQVSP